MSHGQGKGSRTTRPACADANSKHWFTTSILWRKVPESYARCARCRAEAGGFPSFLLRRSGSLTSVKNAVVAAGQTEHRLQLPDYVWKENGSNVLLLEVQSSVPVHVTEVKLERRPQLGEKVSGVLFVQALDTKST